MLGTDNTTMADVLQLLGRVKDSTDTELIHVALERGLDKIPIALRNEVGLSKLSPEQYHRVLADAEAMILYKLAAEGIRP